MKSAVLVKGMILALALVSMPLAAQRVDESELRAGSGRTVDFLNYEGPQARIDSREQIRSIGAALGAAVAGGGAAAGNNGRYFVIHSVTGPEENRLDADIFGLGAGAGVDHVRNLRLIVQGYLQSAYAYSEGDAALLAEFITVYNAVYRGNWDYFQGRYKNAVMGHLDRQRAGLSTRFDEWPGRTLMAIPLLTGAAGSLSAIDTGALVSSEVIEDLRSRDDQGLESRRNMVDFMERESAQAQAQADAQRQAAAAEQERIDRERAAAAAERERLAREREQLAAARASDPAQGEGEQDQNRRQEEADLAAREAALSEQESRLARDQEEAERQRREAEQNQALAEQRESQARDQRLDIASDQQAAINRNDGQGAAASQGIVGVQLSGGNSSLGRLVRINSGNGAQLRAGGMTTVNARTLCQAGGKLIAIAGENRGNGAIRLVEIHPETLEMVAQGDTDIHPQSLLWQSGDSLYAITVSGGKARLARFNTSLAKLAESSISVHPLGAPNVQGNVLLMQREDGSATVLNVADLSERGP